ncbi:molecular chaperone DnaJ [Wolbachia endosymbiont of Drosophila mauritiana]|uniref:molecular chaperone DnaJ n=1 Tax=unclassified Wolbachia TaxID=2640676 RepID=UPI00107EE3D3|nr:MULTISPECIES: molecular chaperone DnaJ [unclassified Wolbachia]QCB62880.1 molecular chaperone DnaJ [Wolbachia endosymbiont of Drosophila mauritiana]QCB63925.1 molecular chaperone DnaJ [Wolbachia endosymbiont of Drosophila mauritiana]QWE33814.1 Putative DnaJ domain membrane protein [Wolbachia endosymbiont of Drosophila simulans]TGB07934.1 molecular chaperone DnaJ [Wolbachia endosymbiont of Drosophila mauritiana]
MSQHFKLTSQEFRDNADLFNVLEIEAKQVVDKNYEELSSILKKQHRKLILVNHPDKGGDKNRFDQIYKAYQELKKYIEPLELGNPCVKVSIGAGSDGRLTAREFHYRRKLFNELKISEKEAVGKDFDGLIAILKRNDRSFGEDFKSYNELQAQIERVLLNPNLDNFQKSVQIAKLMQELYQYIAKPSIQLLNYITPLKEKRSLIEEDKKTLALKFIERKNALMLVPKISFLPLTLLTTITIGCYFSWWIIAFNIIINKLCNSLVNYYMEKYKNSEISTDEFMSKMNYIALSSKLLINYPLAAFSVYLVTTNFIANGLTVDGAILGPLLLLAVLIEALAPIFSKGCEIYADKHTKDLLEEDPRDRVQKETDLLKWYDLRKLLMPIIMPLVRKCFAEVASEFAERNFDEVKTDMSDVNTEGLSNPQAIKFA